MKYSLEEQLSIIKRGVEEILPQEELKDKILKSIKTKIPLNIKLGCDPSRPDLHLGHSVVLKKLRDFQVLGHNVILVIGDFTAMIGDPTGRNKTRPQIDIEQTKINAKTYIEQASKILDVDNLKIVYNSDWLSKVDFIKIIRLCSNFTVAQFLERDDFSKRYKNNIPISIHEFMYPLAQAYDSVILRSDVELGGTDQKFNLLLGRALQKQYDMEEQAVISLPLIEGTDGVNKMSKSYDNYIAFNDSPNDMYGKILSIPDNLIFKYFELVTDLSLKDINDYKLSLKSDKINHRDLKRKLAREIVSIYYDDQGASLAEQNFDNIFIKKSVPDNIDEIAVLENIKLIDFLLINKLVSSKSEAKRLINQSAVKIDDELITDINFILSPGLKSVIKIGKRRFIKVV
ncbi:MAG: tyrosine--tRNA ligase [Candidatus Marinimicrobia bacterium]|nr:tyrosine--tRNA ligase [Candidatus Neomarinimicrobiota bacterium]|tara:strand:- start:3562 stop:4764 length:1203 start_codon:yes stop_codon:yes gene_type:complete